MVLRYPEQCELAAGTKVITNERPQFMTNCLTIERVSVLVAKVSLQNNPNDNQEDPTREEIFGGNVHQLRHTSIAHRWVDFKALCHTGGLPSSQHISRVIRKIPPLNDIATHHMFIHSETPLQSLPSLQRTTAQKT